MRRLAGVFLVVLLAGCSDAQFREPFARCVINRAERLKLDANKSLLRRAESYCVERDNDWDRVFIFEWRDSYADEVRKIRRKREQRASSPGDESEDDGLLDPSHDVVICTEGDPTPDPDCE